MNADGADSVRRGVREFQVPDFSPVLLVLCRGGSQAATHRCFMTAALIALGANLGDRRQALETAIERLNQQPGVAVQRVSRWHETAPVGGPVDQPKFLNGAALVETSVSPAELQQVLQQIESAAGRQRDAHWQARELDLDLLLYGQQIIDTPTLTVPHPRMAFRRFVIDPAAEIAPEMVHPTIGWTIEQLRDHLHNARPYVAITGPPGVGKTAVAHAAAAAVDGRFLADPATLTGRTTAFAAEAAHASSSLIAAGIAPVLAERLAAKSVPAMIFDTLRVKQLLEIDWRGPAERQSVISDFWIHQDFAYAEVQSRKDPKNAVRKLGPARGVIDPKLLVYLDAPGHASQHAELRTELIGVINRWYRGPVLSLHGVEVHDAIVETVAAIQAMQGEGA